ncbi:polysaccharide export protein [Desertifilum sp. FACHB-1129]|uniref:Periplasmic polysaccharide export protein n=1 Tax=Desertifilum tharense IPPAS B-1220 TaxID=1781255 RepID=A0A1E5QPH7_9CYAN|nr:MULTISPECIES: polysaccharide biosynthesis/export family protein [Desertifilum]MDA0209793.1 polysaccharide export protein [Cyanobacteria bacterium FC1]MBD2310716.1 polysaccharide export protein [Desertifilum sp. FACHB-1129]MBD2320753.1 polysaccharide export protein [Desertifilum sp. FACHB-866]MBD2330881.1 polysaccharide export protein [Desertifilum sp. FACHB-868]OEJ76575.1 periplasmic polysaccharide export protein [Desertifilum tharense IPPAS B-1220]
MFRAKLIVSALVTAIATVGIALPSWALPLSPGDRLRINIPADEGLPETDRFSGVYEVNLDGTLQLPFIDPVPVVGLELPQVQQQLTRLLINEGFFQPNFLRVSVSIIEWAPVQVTVSGAVFEPGRYLINPRQAGGDDPPIVPLTGSYPPNRYLTVAIQAAGGIRPEADIINVRLIRGGVEQVIDVSGVFTGELLDDVPLIAGDRIIIPEREIIQSELVRPSQITPQAIPVFLSNLSLPNFGGNVQVQQVAYGSRFSHAVIAGKCVGGTTAINARRRATLIQTDRTTGQTRVLDRSVEELVRESTDNQDNPFLMPDDGLVCYDSTVTNVTSIFGAIGTILNPISGIELLLRRIFGQ